MSYSSPYIDLFVFLSSFVVGENCDEENDSLFAGHINTQKKNHFRFIKTEFDDPPAQSPNSGISDTGNEPELDINTENMRDVGPGMRVSTNN